MPDIPAAPVNTRAAAPGVDGADTTALVGLDTLEVSFVTAAANGRKLAYTKSIEIRRARTGETADSATASKSAATPSEGAAAATTQAAPVTKDSPAPSDVHVPTTGGPASGKARMPTPPGLPKPAITTTGADAPPASTQKGSTMPRKDDDVSMAAKARKGDDDDVSMAAKGDDDGDVSQSAKAAKADGDDDVSMAKADGDDDSVSQADDGDDSVSQADDDDSGVSMASSAAFTCQACGAANKVSAKKSIAKSAISKAELAKLSPAVRKAFEETAKRAESAEKIAKAERDHRLVQDAIAKAKSLTSNLGVSAAELGPVLKSIGDRDPRAAATITRVLKAANEQLKESRLFVQVGKDSSAEAGDANGKLTALAKSIQAAHKTTFAKAYDLALQQNPGLYDEMNADGSASAVR